MHYENEEDSGKEVSIYGCSFSTLYVSYNYIHGGIYSAVAASSAVCTYMY